MCTNWIAHIRQNADGTQSTQSVAEHCRNTAVYARQCLESAGLGNCAYFAGLLHDSGKRTAKFRSYITAAAAGENVSRGSVVHSFTGVRFLLEEFHSPCADPYQQLTAELEAYAIGAHHGLFDCVDETGNSGFRHRLKRQDIDYDEGLQNLWDEGISQETLKQEFRLGVEEISATVQKLVPLDKGDGSELCFYFGLLARLLTSAVIEGDRRDTMEFMTAVSPHSPPSSPHWAQRLDYMEKKLQSFPSNTPLQRARQEISRKCLESAEKPGGIYRLNVPTGAGKTLGSLRFALAHAAHHQKSRIIFTSPLLSILEQNASVLREYIGDPDMILEHHSNAVQTRSSPDALDHGELLAENWSAPVIITTLAQLLNTLFSGKTTSIRRFQSLCSSIIVIDEVQTVPAKMLSLFNLAVNFLACICGATIVLCSATQPCLEKTDHSICVPITDIVPYDQALWAPFRRTKLVDAGTKKLEEIPAFAREIISQTDSLLIICNKKDEAQQLSQQLSDLNCYHLSAAMCPQHRTDTLARIQARLGKGKVVCVSTQVIEAGVDISFGCVIRLTAGMDNAVQAAGRCNRNGEHAQTLPVYLLNCANENLGRLREIQQAKAATTAVLSRFRRNPERYHGELTGDDAIREYYQLLYQEMPRGYQDFTAGRGVSLYDLLSKNLHFQNEEPQDYILQQAFHTAGQQFEVFDDDTISVLVPYGEGHSLIDELQTVRGLSETRALLERAKPYLVNIYRYQFDILERSRALGCDQNRHIFWLEDGWYDAQTGLLTQQQELQFWEV
jgi:CRISPR-associated endonuclease/helicase Cas3